MSAAGPSNSCSMTLSLLRLGGTLNQTSFSSSITRKNMVSAIFFLIICPRHGPSLEKFPRTFCYNNWKVMGLQIHGMSEQEARAAIKQAEDETGLPATDVFRYSSGVLLDALI